MLEISKPIILNDSIYGDTLDYTVPLTARRDNTVVHGTFPLSQVSETYVKRFSIKSTLVGVGISYLAVGWYNELKECEIGPSFPNLGN